MKCPYCKFEASESGCEGCGADLSAYFKASALSDRLYNRGLKQAQANDLSGAIESLNKSLGYNKHNIASRNLLGLVYGAYGRFGDALRQWVISYNYKKTDNPANAYIESVNSNQRGMEKLNEALKIYNRACSAVHKKSDDIALIQLTKAIGINPDFVDALNLLACCYIRAGENGKALDAVKRVLEIDTQNRTALQYFIQLNHESPKGRISRQKPDSPPMRGPRSGMGLNPRFKAGLRPAQVVMFLALGIILTAFIYSVYIIPPQINDKDAEIARLSANIEESETTLGAQLQQSNDKLAKLEAESAADKKEINSLKSELDIQKSMQSLNLGKSLLNEAKYQEAADCLNDLALDALPDEYLNIAQQIKNTAYPKLEQSNYTSGVTAFNRSNYADAKQYFMKSMEFSSVSNTYIDRSLYYLGRIAELDEDYTAARTYYERIVNDYTSSSQYYNAKSRLANLPAIQH